MKQTGNLLIGAAVGAVLVGGIWFFTSHASGNGNIVATVGTTDIKRADFVKELEISGGSQTLGQLVVNQLIRDAAQKSSLTATTQDVDAALADLKKNNNNMTDAQLNQALASKHITLDYFRKQLEVQVLEKKLSEKDVKITDADIQAYYDKNKAQLGTPEQVTASHILVKTEDEAKAVEKRLSSGEDFAKVAKEVSIDPGSKDKGGDLGTFGKGQMDPAFEKAAFSLKPGAVSDPVKSSFGWHVIKVTSHQDAKIPALADVKTKIIDALKQEKAIQPQQLISQLAKNEQVKILDPNYSDVINQIQNPQAGASGGTPAG